MRFIDMHLHTTASDGSCTPSEVCQLAIDRNLAAIAITDHDTVDGVADAITYADNWNSTLPPIQNSDSTNCSGFSDSSDHHIEVVPGIEMSAIYNGVEIHILGFYMDYKNPELISRLAAIKQARYDRNEQMCERFRADGIDMTMEKLQHGNPDTVVTRAHSRRRMQGHEPGVQKVSGQEMQILHSNTRHTGRRCHKTHKNLRQGCLHRPSPHIRIWI